MTPKKSKAYLKKVISDAINQRNKLNGYKASVTKKFKSMEISEAEKQSGDKRIENIRDVLNEYINYHRNKFEAMKGSGIRRKKGGGNVMFCNNPKELLKKLELIIGERLAGNTSIEIRNMGVALLDTLLKTFAINKSQYEKLYKKHFKI